jgi:hypothetical protein
VFCRHFISFHWMQESTHCYVSLKMMNLYLTALFTSTTTTTMEDDHDRNHDLLLLPIHVVHDSMLRIPDSCSLSYKAAKREGTPSLTRITTATTTTTMRKNRRPSRYGRRWIVSKIDQNRNCKLPRRTTTTSDCSVSTKNTRILQCSPKRKLRQPPNPLTCTNDVDKLCYDMSDMSLYTLLGMNQELSSISLSSSLFTNNDHIVPTGRNDLHDPSKRLTTRSRRTWMHESYTQVLPDCVPIGCIFREGTSTTTPTTSKIATSEAAPKIPTRRHSFVELSLLDG